MESNYTHSEKFEMDFSLPELLVLGRACRLMVFTLDDFSEIVTSRLRRHLRGLGVSSQQMKKLTQSIIPPNKFVSSLELHVRQIQFKVGIHTREVLDDYLTKCIGYDFSVEKIVFIPNKKYKHTSSEYVVAPETKDFKIYGECFYR